MVNDNLALTGNLTIAINNEVVQETPNLVVTAGKKWVANRMKDTVSGFTQKGEMSHMAIGTGKTVAADGNKVLDSESKRKALTTAGGTVVDNIITYECTFAAGEGSGAIIEAGIFDAATDGEMLARTVFTAGEVNKGDLDSMTITWAITVS